MAPILTQTDTAADDGVSVGCSGAPGGTGAQNAAREATENGSAGNTEATLEGDGGIIISDDALVMFQTDKGSNEPDATTWGAGDWTIRLNVTTAKSNYTWSEVHICEFNGGSSAGTVASKTNLGIDIGSAGTKSVTVSQGADYTPTDSTSTVYIVLVFSNKGGTWGMTPDQDIDTPIVTSTTYDLSVAEALTLDDTPSVQVSVAGAVVEGLGLGDVVSTDVTVAGTVAETVGVGDTVTAQATIAGAIAEALAVGDTAKGGFDIFKSVDESMTFTDTVDMVREVLPQVAETLSVGDSVSAFMEANPNVSELVNVNDIVEVFLQVQAFLSEGLDLNDSVATALTVNADVPEELTVGDLIEAGITQAASGAEAAGFGDTVAVEIGHGGALRAVRFHVGLSDERRIQAPLSEEKRFHAPVQDGVRFNTNLTGV